ncbi:mitochondrial iron uptake protein [Mucor ambiguus]|uniref:ferroxidase n=1 Tax=Mucor ambiguus TaxID=91626 RepID=A0A0C9MIX5_9FUNG|nr:mitochondrial iron uptake protein [Mucor ambiguus]
MLRQIARASLHNTARRVALAQLPRRSFQRPSTVFVPCILQPTTSNRYFSFSSSRFNESPSYTITDLTTERYHRLSDEVLDHMVTKLEELADETEMEGFDVEYNQGVMTISVGEHGTYVINKQPPNHQIWLSSPVSGPQRRGAEYRAFKSNWTRDRFIRRIRT